MIDEIIRSDRRSVGLTISQDGRVVVRAPNGYPDHLIQRLVLDKASWIGRHKARIAARPKPGIKQFIEGEKFLFLGNHYPLKICVDLDKAVTLSEDSLNIAASIKYRQDQIIAWYQYHAKFHIMETVRGLSAKFGIPYKSIKIRDARTRWGSCVTGGGLSFTWRLIMAPKDVVDYVVVHELAHVRHMDHSARFWRQVGQMMPEYARHERWLKENGHLLVL